MIWKKAPFLRILVSLVAGIMLQWRFQFEKNLLLVVFIFFFITVSGIFLVPFFKKFLLQPFTGLLVCLLVLVLGALLARYQDLRNDPGWFARFYRQGQQVAVSLLEAPVEKTNSFKANAAVDVVMADDTVYKTRGNIIIYFRKDSSLSSLAFGSRLHLKKPLQEIRNSGNPGGFDYKRYCLFQDITHQVYLKETEYVILPGKKSDRLTEFLVHIREKVLSILRKNIQGEKELGLAQALLIGYKNDLDKNLVQSYSNTGVIHVIAISGLHLGLIYWLLLMLLKPFEKRTSLKWLHPILVISGLWLFCLLAGAQPSIVRSAVMFTCIVLGNSLVRKTSIYNTLSFSAFLLLCYNPYWLWDVGFQLSYAAVLSIVIFLKPVYSWFYFRNKTLDLLWKMNAVTIAAQILTLPVSIYHFHQFPVSFLLTNFIAVPLSSLILLGLIFLCSVSFIPVISFWTGAALSKLITWMNSYIEHIESFPFSLWDGLQISMLQAAALMLTSAFLGFWLAERSKSALTWGLSALLLFFMSRTVSFIRASEQEKLIVYNIPKKKAIDYVNGRNYYFIGDPEIIKDDFIRNFHIKPSRIKYRVSPAPDFNKSSHPYFFRFSDKNILIIDQNITQYQLTDLPDPDYLIISKNPKLNFRSLSARMRIGQIIFDGSVPQWKLKQWKQECELLNIPCYDVTEKGAFVINAR